jgi:transposase-like protein
MSALNQEEINTLRSCKYCRSTHVIKYGVDKGTQMYYCYECRRKFARIDTLPQMHTRTADLAEALTLYYSGMSLNDIRRHFIDQDNNYFSKATIYNWINRFSAAALRETSSVKPEVSNCWLIKEITIGIDANNVNLGRTYLKSRSARKAGLRLILDTASCFLLSLQLDFRDASGDIEGLLAAAVQKAGEAPAVIITNQTGVSNTNSEVAVNEKPASQLCFKNDPRLIGAFDDILDQRTRFVCALKNQSTLGKFVQGWQVHYNFFKTQDRLGGKTPAQFAGIVFPYRDWKGLIGSELKYMVAKRKTAKGLS